MPSSESTIEACRELLPGYVRQHGLSVVGREGVPIEELLRRSPGRFPPFKIRCVDASMESKLLNAYIKSGDIVVRPPWAEPVEHITSENIREIENDGKRIERIIGIMGTFAPLLNFVHHIQKTSDRLESITAIDHDERAIWNAKMHRWAYGQEEECPVYYLERPRRLHIERNGNVAEERGYNTVETLGAECQTVPMLEFFKRQLNENTVIDLKCGDMLEEIEGISGAPKTYYVYLSNILASFKEGLGNDLYLNKNESYRLFSAVENNNSIANGSVLAAYMNRNLRELQLFKKEKGKLYLEGMPYLSALKRMN